LLQKNSPDAPFRQTIDIYDFISFLKNRRLAFDKNIPTILGLKTYYVPDRVDEQEKVWDASAPYRPRPWYRL
jgi:hypothetical protein